MSWARRAKGHPEGYTVDMVNDVMTCFHCKKPLANGIVLVRSINGSMDWSRMWHTYCPVPSMWIKEIVEALYYYV